MSPDTAFIEPSQRPAVSRLRPRCRYDLGDSASSSSPGPA